METEKDSPDKDFKNESNLLPLLVISASLITILMAILLVYFVNSQEHYKVLSKDDSHSNKGNENALWQMPDTNLLGNSATDELIK